MIDAQHFAQSIFGLDPEDIVRRQLANSLRVGMLNYVVATSVPPDLAVSVRLQATGQARITYSFGSIFSRIVNPRFGQ